MRIQIDIGHPGHVHLFKFFAHRMIAQGHAVHFTVREKEFELRLLEAEGFSYTNFGKHYKTKSGKIWGLAKFTWLSVRTSRKFKPDIYLSHGSLYNAFAAFFTRKPNIAFEDTGNHEQVRLYLPFTKTVLTSTDFLPDYGEKQIRYAGYHELAYLHPNVYTPAPDVSALLGIGKDERYVVVRFVSWNASHDVGQTGFSNSEKITLVRKMAEYARVFITSEGQLPEELRPFAIKIAPERMHDVLAHAALFIGEGATMASECVMLGTPAIYVNTLLPNLLVQQEKVYGLVHNFQRFDGVIDLATSLLSDPDYPGKMQEKRQKLLAEKIDLTAFTTWFVENYPASVAVLKNNPDYQYTFQ